jgi:AcrR family transcriptional regulator
MKAVPTRERSVGAPGENQPLHRERIVDAALALIDREGVRALSMRRVASELGAGTMSLYSHVADKRELLDAVLARVLDGVEYRPASDMRESARRLALDIRARFLEHPQSIELLAGGAEAEPLVQSLGDAYRDLTARDVPEDSAVRMIQAVTRYTIGSLLAELYGPHANSSRAQSDIDFEFGLAALFAGFAVLLGVDPDNPGISRS